MNGDGLADLIIGAIGFSSSTGGFLGASYVVFGTTSAFATPLNLSSLNGANGFKINGATAEDSAGYSVSGAGDVNGDGLGDLIIGTFNNSPIGDELGSSYVVFGTTNPFGASLELSTLDGTNGFQINGETASDSSGSSVSAAGDVNGDGLGDLIIGARRARPNGDYSGASYVLFGKADAFATPFALSNLDGANGFKINGEAEYDYSGWAVSAAGDVNRDGLDDLIIGAHGANANGIDSGASYVIFGKAGPSVTPLALSSLDGANGFKINGEAANDYSGWDVSAAGDVNGDGADDLIIGARSADANGSMLAGASHVIFGGPVGTTSAGGTGGTTGSGPELAWTITITAPRPSKAVKFKAGRRGIGTVKGTVGAIDFDRKTDGVQVQIALVTPSTSSNSAPLRWTPAGKVGSVSKKRTAKFQAKKLGVDATLSSGDTFEIRVRATKLSSRFEERSTPVASQHYTVK